MNEYKKVKLAELIDISTGRLDANAADDDGLYPFYTCADIPLRINKIVGDYECILLVGNGANTGKVFHNIGPFNAYQRTYILKPTKIECCRYLFWFLNYKTSYFLTRSIGSATNYIKLGDIQKLDIPLYPIETQKQIAATLDKVTKIITENKTLLEKYDLLIKSRFIEMFGDPVTNPMGWEVKKLGDICNKISDGVHAKPDYTTSGRPFISVVNINSGKLKFDDCKFVSEDAYQKMIKSTNPEKDDILYTKVGATYGIPALVDTELKFCLYVSVALLKPKHDLVNSQFLTISMAQPYVKNQADRRIKGIGVPDLHLNQIREFNILLPPLELQNQFNAFVQQIDKSEIVVQKSLEKAETLYKSLMQEYFG